MKGKDTLSSKLIGIVTAVILVSSLMAMPVSAGPDGVPGDTPEQPYSSHMTPDSGDIPSEELTYVDELVLNDSSEEGNKSESGGGDDSPDNEDNRENSSGNSRRSGNPDGSDSQDDGDKAESEESAGDGTVREEDSENDGSKNDDDRLNLDVPRDGYENYTDWGGVTRHDSAGYQDVVTPEDIARKQNVGVSPDSLEGTERLDSPGERADSVAPEGMAGADDGVRENGMGDVVSESGQGELVKSLGELLNRGRRGGTGVGSRMGGPKYTGTHDYDPPNTGGLPEKVESGLSTAACALACSLVDGPGVAADVACGVACWGGYEAGKAVGDGGTEATNNGDSTSGDGKQDTEQNSGDGAEGETHETENKQSNSKTCSSGGYCSAENGNENENSEENDQNEETSSSDDTKKKSTPEKSEETEDKSSSEKTEETEKKSSTPSGGCGPAQMCTGGNVRGDNKYIPDTNERGNEKTNEDGCTDEMTCRNDGTVRGSYLGVGTGGEGRSPDDCGPNMICFGNSRAEAGIFGGAKAPGWYDDGCGAAMICGGGITGIDVGVHGYSTYQKPKP